jgi:hypothetical protein
MNPSAMPNIGIPSVASSHHVAMSVVKRTQQREFSATNSVRRICCDPIADIRRVDSVNDFLFGPAAPADQSRKPMTPGYGATAP